MRYTAKQKKTMILKNKQVKEVEVVTDVVCDVCGESCKAGTFDHMNPVEGEEPQYQFEYMKLKVSWGFFSRHDLETWTADVCESCVEKVLMPVIPFKKTGSIGGQPLNTNI